MSDLKMNMSLDEIIKNNPENPNVNKSKGYLKKTRFNRNNFVNRNFKDPEDNKERRNLNNNMNNRYKFYNKDYNNRHNRNNFNPNYRKRLENNHRNKVNHLLFKKLHSI